MNYLKTLFLFVFLSACTPKAEEVQIRVRNNSIYTFENVLVNTSGGEYSYGNIPAGSASDYHTFQFAYRYAYFSLQINGSDYVIQPVDYVGEEKLVDGQYTYVLAVIDTSAHQLSLTFIED